MGIACFHVVDINGATMDLVHYVERFSDAQGTEDQCFLLSDGKSVTPPPGNRVSRARR